MAALTEEWHAEVVDLKKQGLESAAIAEAVGKHPATVRKVIARAREEGMLSSNGHGGHDPLDDLQPDEEPIGEGDGTPEAWDGKEDFEAEAGEAVGPMPPSRAVDPQDGLFDKEWDDEALEAVLEAREETRAAKLAATKAHKLKDDGAKALLEGYELAVGEVARIGRFRIKKTQREGREVSFVTEPSEQLRIKAGDE